MSKLTALIILSSCLSACGTEKPTPPDTVSAPSGVSLAKSELARARMPSLDDVASVGDHNMAFACDLFRRVVADNEGHNVVLSPYSISTALAMAYAGARGQTEVEMQATLHFDVEQRKLHQALNAIDLALAERGEGKAGADSASFRIDVENSIWQRRDLPVEAAFLDTLARNYGAGVFMVDFAAEPEKARTTINGWIAEKTDALIPELLPEHSITMTTQLVLTNTVYFNASWQTTFDPSATRAAMFTKADGTQVSASFMTMAHELAYAEGKNYRAVALPYADDELRFIAVLPNDGAYADVEGELSATWLEALLSALVPTDVALVLPKLDYATHTSLKPQLQALGMRAAFEASADFSGITKGSLAINDVIHEAVLKVSEGGTIAAAATAVTFRDGGVASSEKPMTLDHPFVFAIVDRATHSLLFVGRVLDPTAH